MEPILTNATLLPGQRPILEGQYAVADCTFPDATEVGVEVLFEQGETVDEGAAVEGDGGLCGADDGEVLFLGHADSFEPRDGGGREGVGGGEGEGGFEGLGVDCVGGDDFGGGGRYFDGEGAAFNFFALDVVGDLGGGGGGLAPGFDIGEGVADEDGGDVAAGEGFDGKGCLAVLDGGEVGVEEDARVLEGEVVEVDGEVADVEEGIGFGA